MSALKTIEKAIATHIKKSEKELEALREKERALIRASIIQCAECKKRSRLCRWTFIQDHWYTPPRDCTEGDHWNASKIDSCHMVCPHCKAENYIFNHPQKGKILRLVARTEGNPWGMVSVFKEVRERHAQH